MAVRTVFQYTYADFEGLTGLSGAAISQNVRRGNLDPSCLVSVAAFLARHGTPEVRMEIVSKMIGLDRQYAERSRPQATRNIGRDAEGRIIKQPAAAEKKPRKPRK